MVRGLWRAVDSAMDSHYEGSNLRLRRWQWRMWATWCQCGLVCGCELARYHHRANSTGTEEAKVLHRN